MTGKVTVMTTTTKTYDVDPSYGGADHPHPHDDPEVDQGYGGENSPHRHDPRYPGVDPSYGGDSSRGYLHRTGLDEDDAEA